VAFGAGQTKNDNAALPMTQPQVGRSASPKSNQINRLAATGACLRGSRTIKFPHNPISGAVHYRKWSFPVPSGPAMSYRMRSPFPDAIKNLSDCGAANWSRNVAAWRFDGARKKSPPTENRRGERS
jgi:hypothetical protein